MSCFHVPEVISLFHLAYSALQGGTGSSGCPMLFISPYKDFIYFRVPMKLYTLVVRHLDPIRMFQHVLFLYPLFKCQIL